MDSVSIFRSSFATTVVTTTTTTNPTTDSHFRVNGWTTMENSTLEYQTMELGDRSSGQLQDLAVHYFLRLLLAILPLLLIAAFNFRPGAAGQPPSLKDPIPFVFNTAQFVYGNEKFMGRVK